MMKIITTIMAMEMAIMVITEMKMVMIMETIVEMKGIMAQIIHRITTIQISYLKQVVL